MIRKLAVFAQLLAVYPCYKSLLCQILELGTIADWLNRVLNLVYCELKIVLSELKIISQ